MFDRKVIGGKTGNRICDEAKGVMESRAVT